MSRRSTQSVRGLSLPEPEAGHVQQVLDEAVEAFGLVLDRLGQVEPVGGVQRALVRDQAGCRAQDGGQRRPQVVRQAGQQGRAQAFRFRRQPCVLDVGDEVGALYRDGGLIRQRAEQPAVLGRKRAVPSLDLDAQHPDRSPAGLQGQEQPGRGRQRGGAASGGFGVRPRPFRRRPRLVVQPVFRRIARPDDKLAALRPHLESRSRRLRQQDQRPAVDCRGNVVDDRPQHVVLVGRRRDLAAEAVQVGGAPGAQPRRLDLGADAGGKVAGDDGGQQEEHHRQDVLDIGDVEREQRIGEEEVVGQGAGDRRRRWTVPARGGSPPAGPSSGRPARCLAAP